MSLLTVDPDPHSLATDLEASGFVCLENAISPEWLDDAASYVMRLVEKHGNRYFALNWPSRDVGSPPNRLVSDPAVRRLLDELVRLGCSRATTESEIYNVLRVVTGDSSGDKKSLAFHYDNTVITVLTPILIPEGQSRRAGELIAWPNRRNYRWATLANVVEKSIVQSNWYRNRVIEGLPDGRLDEIRMLRPGNLYFFWGYRTYHANFPVSPGMVRATLLMHHGDPHPNSMVMKALKAANLRRERRNLAAQN